MENELPHQPVQKSDGANANSFCAHGRLIDDVRAAGGKRTGKVRCFECGTIFDDPYQGFEVT